MVSDANMQGLESSHDSLDMEVEMHDSHISDANLLVSDTN